MYKPDYLTLQEIAAGTIDGQKLVPIVSEFLTGLTLLHEAPWKEATHIDKDVSVFNMQEERMAQSAFRALGEGYTPSKDTYYKRVSALGKVSIMRKFEVETIEAQPNGEFFMKSSLDNMMRVLGNDTEFSILNISQDTNPSAPEGLLPRYSILTDVYGEILNKDGKGTGVKSPYVCLDALGAKTDTAKDGKLSSILVVYFDPINGVSLLYPYGSGTIGFDRKVDQSPYWYKDENDGGREKRMINGTGDITCGITVNNSLACTRIANIDPSDETSTKTALDLLFNAYDRMDNFMKQSVRIFTTLEVANAVRKLQYKNVYHTSLASIQALNLNNDIVVGNDVLTTCYNMLHTEGRIEGITA